jgi:hypothetical protein
MSYLCFDSKFLYGRTDYLKAQLNESYVRQVIA